MLRKVLLLVLAVGGIWAADRLSQMALDGLAARNCYLAYQAFREGNYIDAEESAYAGAREARWLRPKDFRLTNALNNLGLVYYHEQKLTESEAVFAESLAHGKRFLPANSPDLANARANLGDIFIQQKRYAEAEPLLRAAIQTGQHLGVAEREFYPRAEFCLGQVLENTGRREEAVAQFKHAVEVFEHDRGKMDPGLTPVLSALARTSVESGHTGEAEQLLLRAIAISEKYASEFDNRIAEPLGMLANRYAQTGRSSESAELQERARKVLYEHPTTPQALLAVGLMNRGIALRNRKQFQQSVASNLQAEGILLREVGSGHPYLAICWDNVGTAYRDAGRFEESEAYFQKALSVYAARNELDGGGAAVTYSNQALLYYFEQRDQDAVASALKAEQGMRKVYGTESLEYSTLLNRMGLARSGTGDLAQAENDLRYSLAIRLKLLPADHNWIGISVDNLVRVLQLEEKQAEVANVLQEVEKAKQRQILERALH